MLKIRCMFDNHTFAPVEVTDRKGIGKRARELIAQKRGASFFVRDEFDATMTFLDWHSRDRQDGLNEWLDRVLIEDQFRKLLAA